MADHGSSFAEHAGRVLFPRSPGDLTSVVQCPACFTALSSRVCHSCGLDLNHPAAAELAQKSQQVAALLDERLEVIGRMRFETAQAIEQKRVAAIAASEAEAAAAFEAYERTLADAASTASTTVAPPTPAAAVPSAPTSSAASPPPAAAASAPPAPAFAPPGPAFAPPGPPAAAFPPPAASPAPAPRRTSSIQVLLLIAGVSLVSLAAVLFLIYAFVNFGIEWRSAIIAAITIATFTIASLLRRRNYTATAEGIAVFAVVLVYLDAYAVRANNLFGSESSDPQVYWGITLLGSALGFILWHRLSALRVASVAGFAAVAPGAGLLLYGLSEQLDQPTRVFLSFAAMAVTGLLHPLAARRARGEAPASPGVPERAIVLTLASVGVVVAFAAAFFIRESFWGPTIALGGLAVIAFAHTVVATLAGASTLRTVNGFARAFAAAGAIAASSAFAATLTQNPEPVFAIIMPTVAAVAIALALDTVWRRLSDGVTRGMAGAATIAALAVAGLGVIAPLVLSALLTLSVVTESTYLGAWDRGLGEALVEPSEVMSGAVAAVAIVAALAVGFSAASRTLRSRRIVLVAAVGTAAVVAVPLLVVTGAVIGTWFLVAAVGLAIVILSVRRVAFGVGIRLTLAFATLAATILGYLASWASLDTWIAGSALTIVLLLVARLAFPSPSAEARAGLLALAALTAVVAAIGLAQQVTLDARIAPDVYNAVRFVGMLATGLLILAALPRAIGLTPADRRTLFWIGFPLAIGSEYVFWNAQPVDVLVLAEHGTSLAVSSGLLVALLLWIVLRGNAPVVAERIAASIALAPAGFWVLDALARLLDLPIFTTLAPIMSALLVAAGALAVSILRPSGTPRWAREAGIALVAIPAVVFATVSATGQTWLVLLLAGVTVLLLAISADGLFASGSNRKQLGWLALALATAGLWWRLATAPDAARIEAYVLPVAGALLLIALLVWNAHRRASEPTSDSTSAAAPFIALGGLLVAVIPIAVAGATGSVTRAIVIGAVSAVLLLGGSHVLGTRRVEPYLDAAAATGALGVLTVTIGRVALSVPPSDARLDAWLGGALIILIAAAFGQTVRRAPNTLRTIIGQSLAAIGVLTALVFEVSALSMSDLAQLRVLAWVIVFAVIGIVALTVDRGPFRVVIGWIGVASVAVLGFTSVFTGTLSILEASGLLVLVALGSSATALAVSVAGRSTVSRATREIGLALIALVSLAMLPLSDTDTAWLVLEIAAVAALLVAISPDGIFGSASMRKHLGWLALALAVGGLWWRLAGTDVRNVEPYVLPLAGALMLIAALVWRSRRAQADGPGAAPLITLGGLLIAIVPLALNGATGSIVRPIVVGLVCAALLLVGSLVVGSARVRPYLDVAAAAGAVGVLVVAIGRSWFITLETSTPDAALDAWLAASLVALLIAAFGQARVRVDDRASLRSGVAQGLVILAMTIVLVFEVMALDDSSLGFTPGIDGSSLGFARALGTLLLFCVIHVIAVAVDTAPFTRLVSWIALGFAALTAGAGLVNLALDEVEFASVPIALALVAGGLLHMQRVAEARSWPHLGPGLLVLLVPSLLVAIEDRPIWRIAAIAIVAILVLIAGLVGRLQAPFLIGALVTIVHTVTTLWPQLRELYEVNSWLVWIVIGTIGGTLLIVLAARFEKSLNTARSTLRRVGELR